MKNPTLLFISVLVLTSCFSGRSNDKGNTAASGNGVPADPVEVKAPEKKALTAADIKIEKQLLYDQHTLEDRYPYKDTVREFQWEQIREKLAMIENMQSEPAVWAIVQNYKNGNREAPVVQKFVRNEYNLVTDMYGVERYQSVPMYPAGSSVPERYSHDGSPVRLLQDGEDTVLVETVHFEGRWNVPKRYIKVIGDTIKFDKIVFVDRNNQNIAALEGSGDKWLVRSMNPATTGAHTPPYAHPTPLGFYVIQEKKAKMIYMNDGGTALGGFAPWASRFTNGAYIHGVPVNAPRSAIIEFSSTLGTIPRSHMCVRNASSHAKFIYDWQDPFETLVFVIE